MRKIILSLLVSTVCFSQSKNSEAFNSFFFQFKKSKSFQLERTLFPIKVIHEASISESGNLETLLITKKNWEFSDFSASKNRNLKISQVRNSSNNYTVIFQIEDTGFYLRYFFKKLNGKWFLYKIRDEST